MRTSRLWRPVLLGVLPLLALAWTLWSDSRNDSWSPRAGVSAESSPVLGWDAETSLLVNPPAVIEDRGTTLPVDFDPEPYSAAVHADAVGVPVPVLPGSLPEAAPQAPPATLPQTANAQPIDARTANAERDLDELIARELADLPDSQRSVWRDVLNGLTPDEARDIIQIWKLTGRLNAPSAEPAWSAQPSGGSLPGRTTAAPHELVSPRTPDERLADRNLQHLATPGFRRRMLLSHNVTERQAADGVELRSRLDLSAGQYRATGNPLHLAIEGAGFFILRRGEQLALTRNGEFDLSAENRIVQHRIDGEWLLEPGIDLPKDAAALIVDPDGSVYTTSEDAADRQLCGQIRLGQVLNPQYLASLEADLLAPSNNSGEVSQFAPGHEVGVLLSGTLEGSNATREKEVALLEAARSRTSAGQAQTVDRNASDLIR